MRQVGLFLYVIDDLLMARSDVSPTGRDARRDVAAGLDRKRVRRDSILTGLTSEHTSVSYHQGAAGNSGFLFSGRDMRSASEPEALGAAS